jgi:hypothetical protein
LKSKENLKKRQKYDPRKAIQEAKKVEGKEPKENKSAFPEGLINKQPEPPKSSQEVSDVEQPQLKRKAYKPPVQIEEESKSGPD